MVQISRWKMIAILLVVLIGFLYAMPNVLSPDARAWTNENLPGWFPQKTVNLGLDLRGGAHLLYEVDVDAVFKEQAELLRQDLSGELRKERIARTGLGVIDGGIKLTLRDESDGEEARKIIRRLQSDLSIDTQGATIEAVLNETGRQAIYDQTISQSIEIVRRRIDELGTTEPVIQRQGDAWYDAGDLEFYQGDTKVGQLVGVSRPDSFRATCLKAHSGFVGVQAALE